MDVEAFVVACAEQLEAAIECLRQADELRPCELQLYGFFPKLGPGVSLLLATAIWSGHVLTDLVPRSVCAEVLIDKPVRALRRYYLYAVARSPGSPCGTRYAYVHTPEVIAVEVCSPEGRQTLLELDLMVATFAALASA